MEKSVPAAGSHQGSKGILKRRLTPVVWAAIGLLCVYWLAALFVFAADPYELYPWGMRSTLPRMDTTDNSIYLIAAAARQPDIDLVMIGSSVSKSYYPEQIQAAFPGYHHAWNESYPAASPADRALTIETFQKYSRATRYVIWIDWSYTLPAEQGRAQFPTYLYDDSVMNDLQMVSPQTVAMIWRMRHGAGPFRDSDELMRKDAALDVEKYRAFQVPASMRELEGSIRARRQQLSSPWRSPCDGYTALSKQLVPELKEFSRRHIAVDLVFPAYAAVAYYDSGSRGIVATLPEQLNMRRCVVETTAGIPGVNVWAPDIDTALITRISDYKNPTHIYSPAVLARVLASIGDPAYRVDPANVDVYLDRLRATVLGYDIDLDHYRDPRNSTQGNGKAAGP